MIDRKPLFDQIRTIAGRPLHQPEVVTIDRILDGWDAPKSDPLTIASTRHLSREEGRVAHAYQDHMGFWTIGVGRLIDKRKGGRLRNDEIDLMLSNDIADRIAALKDWPAWKATKGNVARQVALLSLAFQLGTAGLADFKNSLAMCAAGRWAEAADNFLKSAWAKQTPERAKRVTDMIRTGEMA